MAADPELEQIPCHLYSDGQHVSALSARVALVAVHAVVDIAVDARVPEVRRVIAAVALRALEDRIVV